MFSDEKVTFQPKRFYSVANDTVWASFHFAFNSRVMNLVINTQQENTVAIYTIIIINPHVGPIFARSISTIIDFLQETHIVHPKAKLKLW